MTIAILNRRDLNPGWNDDPQVIYVGRESRWGNPYRMGDRVSAAHFEKWPLPITLPIEFVFITRAQAVELYRRWALTKLEGEPDWLDPLLEATALVCWCAPQECHAQVLVEFIAAALAKRVGR